MSFKVVQIILFSANGGVAQKNHTIPYHNITGQYSLVEKQSVRCMLC